MTRASRGTARARALLGYGELRPLHALALCTGISGLSALALFAHIDYLATASGRALEISDATAGDALLWLFFGDPTNYSLAWMALWVVVLFLCLPEKEVLSGAWREQEFVRLGARIRCWLRLCVGTCANTLAVLAMLFLTTGLWMCVLGGTFRLEGSLVSELLFGMSPDALGSGVVFSFLVLLALGACALALLQLVLSVAVGRLTAALLLVAVLGVSEFFPAAAFPGVWLMASRAIPLVASGPAADAWEYRLGFLVFAAVSVVGFCAGCYLFSHKDIGIRHTWSLERRRL